MVGNRLRVAYISAGPRAVEAQGSPSTSVFAKANERRLFENHDSKPKRLLTHSDLDGVVCAVLITTMEAVNLIVFTNPSSVHKLEFKVTRNDILADLPYSPGCGAWFDHHATNAPPEWLRFKGAFKVAPSAARVVLEFYESQKLERFAQLVEAADKIDTGKLSFEEIQNPQGFIKLSITLRYSEWDSVYKHDVVDWLKQEPIEEVLKKPGFLEQYGRSLEEFELFKREVPERTRFEGNVAIVDFRGSKAQNGPNYLLHSIYPKVPLFVKILDVSGKPKTEINVSENSLNGHKTPIDLGELMKRYGGGGHFARAGARIRQVDVEQAVREIVGELNRA